MPNCPQCGTSADTDANYCSSCGNELNRSLREQSAHDQDGLDPTNPESSRWYKLTAAATIGWVILFVGVNVVPNPIWVLLFFFSWIGLPVGIYLDNKELCDSIDSPRYKWAYIVSSLIWLFAVIPGAIYLWKRRSLQAKSAASLTTDMGDDQSSSSQDSGSVSTVGFNVEITANGTSIGEELSDGEKYKQSTNAWVPPGEDISIQGFTLSDGMVYVGTDLLGIEEYTGLDSCLIDPTLEIDTDDLDPEGHRMGYWPSYSDIDPGCRATYLNWLENGRRDPDIAIGYVFLFFYGIERRVLFDASQSSTVQTEIPALLAEVETLSEIYGDESSFSNYASQFLHAARAKYDPDSLMETSPPEFGRQTLIATKIKIGRQIAAGRPLTAELAYEWFQASPNTYQRTPARRCEDEFENLFALKFEDRYGDGWELEPPQKQLTVNYRPASKSIPSHDDIGIGEIPDIEELSVPVEKSQGIANECCDELDSYSRYVGQSDDRESLRALSLLPDVVLQQRRGDLVEAFVDTIENTLDTSVMADIQLDLLLEHFPIDPGKEVNKRDLKRLAMLLEKLGYGIEPDPRFSAPSRGWGDPAVVYRLQNDTEQLESNVTSAIRLIQKLAVRVVLANENVAPEQTEYLSENLGSFLELSEGDHQRLQAHRRWLILDSPTLHGVRQRAEDIPEDRRIRVAKFLTALACSDGNIDTMEVEELSKIYPMLGLEEDKVHAHLHQLQTEETSPDDEPVTVREADPNVEDYRIPVPSRSEDQDAPVLKLDQEKVDKTLEESKDVRKFLSEIFEDPEESSIPSPDSEAKNVESEAGTIDEEHRDFLRELSQQVQWDRSEVEALARERNLFPDAAIEVVNEHAYERFDSAVIEGNEEVRINQELSTEMLK